MEGVESVVCVLFGSFLVWCIVFVGVWSVIINSVGLPLITLLQLTSESTGLYSVSVVKCWWWWLAE